MKYHAIVIGGGHNGLTAAAYLAARRAEGARPRAAARPRGRRGHRGSLSGVSIFGGVVRGVAAAAGNHPRSRSAAARPGDSAARRHVHADAERRPSVARERSREDPPRDRAPLESRRRSVRRVRQGDGRDGAVRQTDSQHDAAGSNDAGSARADEAGVSGQAVPRPRRHGSLQPGPADDDERGRLPRPVVRDRRAQGDDVGIGDHRHIPGRPLAGHGVRPAAPLHGRDRRCVPLVGLRARRHGRHLERDRERGARARRGDPDRGAGRADSRCSADRRPA